MKISNAIYYVKTALVALIGFPLVASLILLGFMAGWFAESGIVAACAVILPLPIFSSIVWHFSMKRANFPDTTFKRLLPVFVPFFYYMAVWIAIFGLSHYRFNGKPFGAFFPLTLPYFMFNVLLSLGGDFSVFPAIQAVMLFINIATYQAMCALKKRRAKADRGLCACCAAALLLCATAGYQHYERGVMTITRSEDAERVSDEVDLSLYRPFEEGNWLETMQEAPTVTIDEDYPRMDGATAAYPVYGAMAQAIYKGLDENTISEYVRCTKTIEAYGRLTDGEIDIFFGAQPSSRQSEAALAKGVEFDLTPIAKEAFVFFVNGENQVSDLTVDQIRDIYRKKITNWRDVGGANERIIPFQRPEGSGSQTIMQSRVMDGLELPPPMWEEYAAGMGGIISHVAEYRNYSSAIGYSFRYFAQGMKPNDGIKLLAVGGVAPTAENIKSGAYPFTIDVYAVTAGHVRGSVAKLIGWILSDQGQDFIERCGYVRAK
jgi:phosphate transport system substrate-binding protein